MNSNPGKSIAPRTTKVLVSKDIEGLKPGRSRADAAPKGAGRLEFRRLTSTGNPIVCYYRYTNPDGKQVRLPVGSFDSEGRRGFTLAQLRTMAGEFSRQYQAGERDLRGAIEAARTAETDARQAAAKLADEASKLTFAALMTTYADMLEKAGRNSAREVRGCVKLHIVGAHPEIACKPAASITTDDALTILDSLQTDGKKRTAAKLRSYMRAAFSAAINATKKAGATDLRAIGRMLDGNPARDLGTIDGASKARKRALSIAELRAYWLRIKGDTRKKALLRAHILLGAQRPRQLKRVTISDMDDDAQALRILDIKGRRSDPREHWVPIIAEAAEALKLLRAGDDPGQFLFSISNGRKGIHETQFTHLVSEMSAEMLAAGEVVEPFTAGDLRRTVETRLAAKGVPMEVRAHLQSHGLSGVQAKNYDQYTYDGEKRGALELLHALITGTPGEVVELRPARASA